MKDTFPPNGRDYWTHYGVIKLLINFFINAVRLYISRLSIFSPSSIDLHFSFHFNVLLSLLRTTYIDV